MLRLTLQTPFKRLVAELSIQEVFVPIVQGTLEVLPGHADYVSEMETGVVRWKAADKWHSAAVSWGFVEIREGHVTVLADTAEIDEEIDLGRAKTAESRARKIIETGDAPDNDLRRHELKLKRAMARQAAIG